MLAARDHIWTNCTRDDEARRIAKAIGLDDPHTLKLGRADESHMQVEQGMRILNYVWQVGSKILEILVSAPWVVGVKVFSEAVVGALAFLLCKVTRLSLAEVMGPVRLTLSRHHRVSAAKIFAA